MKIERVIYEIYEGDGSLRVCAVMESLNADVDCLIRFTVYAYINSTDHTAGMYNIVYFLLMLTYTGQIKQEGMRKTNFRPQSNPGLMTSKPAHQTLSHDHHVTGQFLTGF